MAPVLRDVRRAGSAGQGHARLDLGSPPSPNTVRRHARWCDHTERACGHWGLVQIALHVYASTTDKYRRAGLPVGVDNPLHGLIKKNFIQPYNKESYSPARMVRLA